jgi:putative FmdB family regulatory protein
MPIYEFKCLNCQGCFELLIMNKNETIEMKCPQCSSEELERILSCTHYSLNDGVHSDQGLRTQTRTCSSGSCSTYDIPGPTR